MQRLSRLQRWIYGSGDTGFSLTLTIVSAYFAIFLTDVVRVDPAVAAATACAGPTSRAWTKRATGSLSC